LKGRKPILNDTESKCQRIWTPNYTALKPKASHGILPIYHSTCLPFYLSTILPIYHSTCLQFYLSTILPVYHSTKMIKACLWHFLSFTLIPFIKYSFHIEVINFASDFFSENKSRGERRLSELNKGGGGSTEIIWVEEEQLKKKNTVQTCMLRGSSWETRIEEYRLSVWKKQTRKW